MNNTDHLPLYPYQVEGVRWLASRRDALLADEMGLGKTLQALAALPDNPAVIVVCPASVKGTWATEVARWRPDLKLEVLKGRGSFRWPDDGEVVVLNYDILPKNCRAPSGGGRSWGGDRRNLVLICDEIHYAKNQRASRTKRLMDLGLVVHQMRGRRWGLTATPLLNEPPELRSVLKVLDLAAAAGIAQWNYLKLAFNGRTGRFGTTWGLPRAGLVDNLKRVMLRRRLSVVLPDLPALRHQTHTVNGISPATMALLASVMADLERAGLTLGDILTAEARADRAVSGWSLIFERISEARMALATAKIPAMLEQVVAFEDADEPLVVFSAHRAPVDALAGRKGWGVLTGSTPAEERTRVVAAFQAGDLRGLACTIQAGGIGITLTRASHALFVDLAWTPAANAQAEGRLRRIGQEASAVVIHRLEVDHPLDERVNELLATKSTLISATIEASEVPPKLGL